MLMPREGEGGRGGRRVGKGGNGEGGGGGGGGGSTRHCSSNTTNIKGGIAAALTAWAGLFGVDFFFAAGLLDEALVPFLPTVGVVLFFDVGVVLDLGIILLFLGYVS